MTSKDLGNRDCFGFYCSDGYINIQVFHVRYGKVIERSSDLFELYDSSDEVVSNLYQQKEVIKTITDHFNLRQKEYIDRDELRTLLASNNKYVKEINSIVHPLVKEEIRKFFKEHKKGLLAVEVPLLFESKMEKEFDVIIAVDAPKEKQMELLIARDKQNAQLLKEINGKNNFDRHQNKADFIILNDADLNSLRKKVKNIISKLRCRLD